MSYHGGGIKVEEVASWVGLGRALNAGGVITRTVRGQPDEKQGTGWINPRIPGKLPYIFDGSAQAQDKLWNYAEGNFDSQPDLFYFNFHGKTGKFVLDQDNNAFVCPFQKIQITPSNNYLDDWTIITDDGFIYRFGNYSPTSYNKEICTSYTSCNGDIATADIPYVSSWYLTSITSPTGHVVNFEYVEFNTEKYLVSSFENKYEHLNITPEPEMRAVNSICQMQNEVSRGSRLSKIKFTSGEIDFIASSINRCDLPGDKLLDFILVKDIHGNVLKNIDLGFAPCLGQPIEARSMLVSVQEKSHVSPEKKSPYKFTYFTGLPSRDSYAVDFWGYFNGKKNTGLVPQMTYLDKTYSGANKTPDILYAKAGSLSQIDYPTGGFTKFTYELNESNRGIPNTLHNEKTISPRFLSSGPQPVDVKILLSLTIWMVKDLM